MVDITSMGFLDEVNRTGFKLTDRFLVLLAFSVWVLFLVDCVAGIVGRTVEERLK